MVFNIIDLILSHSFWPGLVTQWLDNVPVYRHMVSVRIWQELVPVLVRPLCCMVDGCNLYGHNCIQVQWPALALFTILVMLQASSDVYTWQLLLKQYGYPLFVPEPYNDLTAGYYDWGTSSRVQSTHFMSIQNPIQEQNFGWGESFLNCQSASWVASLLWITLQAFLLLIIFVVNTADVHI